VFDHTLDLIEDAFEARNTPVVKGAVVDGGPDHYAQIEAGAGSSADVFTQVTGGDKRIRPLFGVRNRIQL
jgi:hypothetical protein